MEDASGDGRLDLGQLGGTRVGARLRVGKEADVDLLGRLADAHAPVVHLALPLVRLRVPADAREVRVRHAGLAMGRHGVLLFLTTHTCAHTLRKTHMRS